MTEIARAAPVPTAQQAFRYALRLLLLVRSFWGRLAANLALGLAIGLVGMTIPYSTKLYFDSVYPSRDTSLLAVLVAAVLLVSIVSAVLSALNDFHAQALNAKIWGATSLLFFNHLQHLPSRFFDHHSVGEILSRFGELRAALNSTMSAVHTLVNGSVYLLLVPPVLLFLNWRLALAAMISIPLTTLIATASSRFVRRYWKTSAEASADVSALQFEALSQIRMLKTLGVEQHLYQEATRKMTDALSAQLTAGGLSSITGIALAIVSAAGTAVFTWLAWTSILSAQMTIGEFLVFSAYLGYLTGPVTGIASLISEFQHTAVTLGRAFEYLDAPVEQDPASVYTHKTVPPRAQGEVALRGITFGYNVGATVLRDVSFTLRPGTVTAVVGASGAGKSSIVRLVCRLEDPSAGTVLLDGMPLEQLPLSYVRSQIGVVGQDATLLRGSLWENLTYGLDERPSALVDRVGRAIESCELSTLVASLPLGLRTPVAEWGATLSGGQRQRFAIARALVRNQPVLVLDEATSQVDLTTENSILTNIFAGNQRRTVLFVTHRVTTALLADQVLVFDAGRLVGAGPSRAVAQSCEPFRILLDAAQSGRPEAIGAAHHAAGTPAGVVQ